MNRSQTLALGLGLLGLAAPLQAQHGHLNSGATGKNQGDALIFINGAGFAASSGYAKELTLGSSGYYEGAITLTAVHSLDGTDANGIPYVANPNGAALGSFIQYEIVSVTGPAGGSFQFWEDDAAVPTFSYASGYAAGATPNLIALSDADSGAGTVGGDPFGHLHGRRFSTSTAGDYTVGFRLVDTSVNGAGGGPIHSPSEVLSIKFSSVPEPGTVALGMIGLLALGFTLRRR